MRFEGIMMTWAQRRLQWLRDSWTRYIYPFLGLSAKFTVVLILFTLYSVKQGIERYTPYPVKRVLSPALRLLGDKIPYFYCRIKTVVIQVNYIKRRWARVVIGHANRNRHTNGSAILNLDNNSPPRSQRLNSFSQEVRLLHLSNVEGGDGIQVRTEVVSLDEEPRYIALSYVWGNHLAPNTVKVDGEDVFVSRNLFEALPFLCKAWGRESGLPFWIDAMSINQKDDTERSEQVLMMKEIYSRAYKVWVWIGLPSESSEVALAKLTAIRILGSESPIADEELALMTGEAVHYPASYKLPEVLTQLPGAWIHLSSEERDRNDKEWNAVYEILRSPWWTRAWIAQEVTSQASQIADLDTVELILGRQLQRISFRSTLVLMPLIIRLVALVALAQQEHDPNCASVQSFQTLVDSLINIDRLDFVEDLRKRDSIVQQALNCLTPHSRLNQQLFRHKVWPILRAFRHMQASDPRDKVYASIPMILPSGHTAMQADYNLSVVEVYTKVVEDFIRSERTLTILSCCASMSDDLPSFVPDWRELPFCHALRLQVNEYHECIYQAAATKTTKARLIREPTTSTIPSSHTSVADSGTKSSISSSLLLITSGVLVDQVSTVSPLWRETKKFRRDQWEAMLLPLPNYYSPTREPLTCAYQRLLVGDVYDCESKPFEEVEGLGLRKFIMFLERHEERLRNWLNRVKKYEEKYTIMHSIRGLSSDRLHSVSRRGARTDPTLNLRKPWTPRDAKEASVEKDPNSRRDTNSDATSPDPDPDPEIPEALYEADGVKSDGSGLEEFRKAIAEVTHNRVLCITEKGYIALMPHNTKAGDAVVVLDGGPVPFVLRSAASFDKYAHVVQGEGEDSQRWCLVGEAYVHGLMDGEAADLGLDTRDFVLV